MISAFSRLLQILFISLVVCILVIFGLRSLGQQDQYSSPFDDAFFLSSPWLIVLTDWQKPDLGPALKATPKDSILGADVQILTDGELIVFPEHFVKDGDQLRFLSTLDYPAFQKLYPGVVTLKEFLQASGPRPVFIRAKNLNRLTGNRLGESLQQLKSEGPVIVQVANQALKKSLKEKFPLWIFANTYSEAGRFQLFTSLGLESIVNLDADVYILDKPNDALVTEIRRRKRKALLITTENVNLSASSAADGFVVTSRPNEMSSKVDQQ